MMLWIETSLDSDKVGDVTWLGNELEANVDRYLDTVWLRTSVSPPATELIISKLSQTIEAITSVLANGDGGPSLSHDVDTLLSSVDLTTASNDGRDDGKWIVNVAGWQRPSSPDARVSELSHGSVCGAEREALVTWFETVISSSCVFTLSQSIQFVSVADAMSCTDAVSHCIDVRLTWAWLARLRSTRLCATWRCCLLRRVSNNFHVVIHTCSHTHLNQSINQSINEKIS